MFSKPLWEVRLSLGSPIPSTCPHPSPPLTPARHSGPRCGHLLPRVALWLCLSREAMPFHAQELIIYLLPPGLTSRDPGRNTCHWNQLSIHPLSSRTQVCFRGRASPTPSLTMCGTGGTVNTRAGRSLAPPPGGHSPRALGTLGRARGLVLASHAGAKRPFSFLLPSRPPSGCKCSRALGPHKGRSLGS